MSNSPGCSNRTRCHAAAWKKGAPGSTRPFGSTIAIWRERANRPAQAVSRSLNSSAEQLGNRFSQSVTRDVERAALDLVGQLGRDAQRPVDGGVQVFDHHAVLDGLAGALLGCLAVQETP